MVGPVPRKLGELLLVLSFPLAAFGQSLTGTVVDPQHRLIVGAKAVLTCDGHSETTESNPEGKFVFAARSELQSCTLTVTHRGFAPFQQVLPGSPGALLIQLRLAQMRYVVTVSPEDEDLRLTSRAALGRVSLSDAELRSISNNTQELIHYAKQLAGVTMGMDSIYVDGLPSSSLPPAGMVARITVNGDPFSAEYSDGDQTRIEITTKVPDRKLRFNFGGASPGLGGRNFLAPGLHSVSRGGDFGLTGPLFRLPVSFSLHANIAYSSTEQSILAVTSQPQGAVDVGNLRPPSSTSYMGSVSFIASYSKAEHMRANLAYFESRAKASNLGVGGLTLPEAGLGSAYDTREVRFTLLRAGANYGYQGGVDINQTKSHSYANTSSLGVIVVGSFVGGGAAVTSDRLSRTSWTWKNVVQFGTGKRLWSAGVTISRSSDFDSERPNLAGVIEFENLPAYLQALAGAPNGTWFVMRGNGSAGYASTSAAPFIEGDLFSSEKAVLRAGLRADYQTWGGVLVSPRLSLAAKLRGFILRAGAGTFVHNWTNDIFLHVIKDDGEHLQRFLVRDVSIADVTALPVSSKPTVASQLAPDLVRPRNLMFKASVERPLEKLVAGIEYTWIGGLHMLGSRRLPAGNNWVDVLESNRLLQKQQMDNSMRYTWKGQSIIGHYQWIRSFDNTDGPFSFPEQQKDLRAEWARTSGVSPHNFSVVGSFKLPSAISVTLVGTARSSAPYNITSGMDVTGNGLFNDRGGRLRHSGTGPAYRSLSLYVYRKVLVPRFLMESKRKVYVNVGLQVDNLLGNKNYFNFDSVAASPIFGRPLAAFPGRSIRVWCSLAQ